MITKERLEALLDLATMAMDQKIESVALGTLGTKEAIQVLCAALSDEEYAEERAVAERNLSLLERLQPGDVVRLSTGEEFRSAGAPKPDFGGGRIFTSGKKVFFLPWDVLREAVRGGATIVPASDVAQEGE